MARSIGSLRRSSIVGQFGPGAIVDFRSASGAPVSAIVAGLEEWDNNAIAKGTLHPQSIFEERLEKKLDVLGFRLPPVNPENQRRGDLPELLVGVRFPLWLQCPMCNALKYSESWARHIGTGDLYCPACSTEPNAKRIHVVPVRFIVACPLGHLDEFPWISWVVHEPGCRRSGDLELNARGAGLAGLWLRCRQCNQERSLDGIFQKSALAQVGMRCKGRRPWLTGGDEPCSETDPPRVVQRGASNLYFPIQHSAISIPPWNEGIRAAFGTAWAALEALDVGQREHFVRTLLDAQVIGPFDISLDELVRRVNQQIELLQRPEVDDFRQQEYLQFTVGDVLGARATQDFEVRNMGVPESCDSWVSRVLQVRRLREVRAISGFTRITSPEFSTEPSTNVARLSKKSLNWLPAIEVRGEGVFIDLNGDRLNRWEGDESVTLHCRTIQDAYRKRWFENASNADIEPPKAITPRLLLAHTLSHALMRQLALECGYSTASLRERLYVGTGENDMCGILIYTGTTDADGTLGGLARQAEPVRLGPILTAAVDAIRWCSSDPICAAGLAAESEGLNFAACHSCLLAPETSCEEYNHFLDRTVAVGKHNAPRLGYLTFEP